MEASWLEESLGKHLTKLRKYIEEYNDLKSWLADMTMLVLGEQHSVKRQVSVCGGVCVWGGYVSVCGGGM